MGERALSLKHAGSATDNSASRRDASRHLEGEIAALREELGGLVAELDRRRHALVDVRGQVKRHALGAVLTAVALIGTASGVVWLGIGRRPRRRGFLTLTARLGEAVTRMIDRPERVAAEPTIPGKILTAAATAAVATLVKKGLERALHAILEPRGSRDVPTAAAVLARWPVRAGNGRVATSQHGSNVASGASDTVRNTNP